ncbi:SMC N domain containing protein [Trichuris trichiura]|uniref:SMC N domain containing protein n=1 Tax=Trichuris trichiura TaxID=36087 RepID=A0A077Z236_TRITR|nr:SMC N domain containing protein [Trichuris trichiura]
MFIREIVMENFKSYGKRTVIQDIDPHFNAITGLNGSGKSNILDGVCFALGISNLREVRAVSLKDLIHIGATAIVSLVFDNSDKATSPPGYEEFDTITISRQVFDGGRLKSMLNGVLAPAARIADVLQSAHLNVNNPHFIVMQGRITRVLNMKAAEILSMIEEATGSKMYDENRARAVTFINKKRQHYLENENVLALEKLEREQAAYSPLFQLCSDVCKLQERIADEEKLVDQLDKEINELRDSIKKCKEACKQLRSEAEAFQKKRENHDKTGTFSIEEKARRPLRVPLREGELPFKIVQLYNSLQLLSFKLRVIEEKRQKCEKDKEEIMKVLKIMQEKKRNALEIALMQINKDFDAIMNIMLPDVNVKLVPVDASDILKGLEIKVAFAGQWLESLTELSGGQRSLVALALIFAMLLFKPAPVYILDEIDAALDVVHTERIGEMIREKFPHSQFLVVSLKEGMFSNANVLYRTRLENGQSNVTRTLGSKYRPMSRDAIAAIRKRHQKEEEFRAAVRSKLANIRTDIGKIELNSSFSSARRHGKPSLFICLLENANIQL